MKASAACLLLTRLASIGAAAAVDWLQWRGPLNTHKTLFTTMIGYMNTGLGAEDVVARSPLKQYQAEFGDPSAFLDGAFPSMQIAYVPD